MLCVWPPSFWKVKIPFFWPMVDCWVSNARAFIYLLSTIYCVGGHCNWLLLTWSICQLSTTLLFKSNFQSGLHFLLYLRVHSPKIITIENIIHVNLSLPGFSAPPVPELHVKIVPWILDYTSTVCMKYCNTFTASLKWNSILIWSDHWESVILSAML